MERETGSNFSFPSTIHHQSLVHVYTKAMTPPFHIHKGNSGTGRGVFWTIHEPWILVSRRLNFRPYDAYGCPARAEIGG
jgi:NADH:ubiquinone oxidoreductase subunit B-like Fe-S oxidoreductase